MPRRIALIMAGGGGTRLWPASTGSRPKPALDPLLDRPPRPLLGRTLDRLSGIVRPEDVYVVTSREHLAAVQESLSALDPDHVIVEPTGRNTAPCVGLAVAHLLAKATPEQVADTTVIALPADHHVRDATTFSHHLATACIHAEVARTIVTLGILPDRADPGFGYIEFAPEPTAAVAGDGGLPVHPVRRFVEKPDVARAKAFVASGSFLWNSGIFVMPLERIAAEFERCSPTLHHDLSVVRDALRIGDTVAVEQAVARTYARADPLPIDVAIMEKQDDLLVVPTRMGWTDLGAWPAVHASLAHDTHGNAVATGATGRVVLDGVRDSLVWSEDAEVIAFGVEGVAVVASRGRVLVCPLADAARVRELLTRENES